MDRVIDLPRSDIDLYGDETLADPYPAYKALRDMGSAVWLDKVGAWFIGRYADVDGALKNWESFSSARGIGLNPVINEAWDEALICQDPPIHTPRRKIMTQALGPAALKPVADSIDRRAADLADRLVAMGTFDGVRDLAQDLPINVVMDLIGWPHDIRADLLSIAEGAWDGAGPAGARTEAGLATMQAMMAMLTQLYDQNRVEPDGYAAQLIAASHRGEISRETAIGMLAGYIVAAFETTIAAMASGAWLFATNPGEWQKLRADPALAMSAANEIVRMRSPLQKFARFVTRDTALSDGSVVPGNSWAIVSYASANRDERRFIEPDRFWIDRKERQNLGFGQGPHNCAGQGLARMELTAVFKALASRIERFELAGEPVPVINNVAFGFSSLPLRAIAA